MCAPEGGTGARDDRSKRVRPMAPSLHEPGERDAAGVSEAATVVAERVPHRSEIGDDLAIANELSLEGDALGAPGRWFLAGVLCSLR